MALKKRILPVKKLAGSLRVGADKSISHRSIILGCLSKGHMKIENFYSSQDCNYTLLAMRSLGVKINKNARGDLDIYGKGFSGLRYPAKLFLGNSGTTYRLLTGLLAGRDCRISLQAARSLSQRPMKRIVDPLGRMGARIKSLNKRLSKEKREIYPPLLVKGGNLKGINYCLPVASAQVKSAILLAALSAKGVTTIIEKNKSRDHTERMLEAFGLKVSCQAHSIKLCGPQLNLKAPRKISIPGDFSSAAFFIVGALLLKGSQLRLKRVGVNPTRIGLLRVLKRMKADFKVIPIGRGRWPAEPLADIVVRSSKLQATQVSRKEIPLLIDEIPILMVAASLARGTTRIRGVGELRVKETDRIASMCYNLGRLGVKIRIKKTKSTEDIFIKGSEELEGAELKSFSDHRTAMSLVIAAICAKKASFIDDTSCIGKSFPDFFAVLDSVKVKD